MKIVLNTEELRYAILNYYPALSGHSLTDVEVKQGSYNDPMEVTLVMTPIVRAKDE